MDTIEQETRGSVLAKQAPVTSLSLEEINGLDKAAINALPSSVWETTSRNPEVSAAFSAKVEEIENQTPTQYVADERNKNIARNHVLPQAQTDSPISVTPADPQPQTAPTDPVPAVAPTVVKSKVAMEGFVFDELSDGSYQCSYQPTDSTGKPLGGRQNFKGSSPAEIIEKLANSNAFVLRMARERERQARLNEVMSKEPIAPQPFTEPMVAQPRDLSPDELSQFSSDLLDSTKAASAIERILEARLGLPINQIGQAVQKMTGSAFGNAVTQASTAFANRHVADFLPTQNNIAALLGYISQKGLDPAQAEAYELAHSKLLAAGAYEVASDIPVPVNPQAEVEQPVVEQPVAQPAPVRNTPAMGISTGLTRRQAGTDPVRNTVARPVVADSFQGRIPDGKGGMKAETITLKDIDRMGSAEIRQWKRNPGFDNWLNNAEEARQAARVNKSNPYVGSPYQF